MKGIEIATRVAVVTGGARGIGRATAEALRDAGARVAIGDVDQAEVTRTATELGVFGDWLDVTDPHSVEAFHSLVEEQLGPVDVWVNNAGIMPVGSFLDQDDAIVRRTVDVNLLGVINGSRSAARRMVERGHGRVVNVASVAGRIPAPGMAVYNGTKFAVVGFSEAIDAELSPHGVHVSTVLPSFTDTGLITGLRPGPMITPVPPARIARTILVVLRRGRRHAVIPRRLSFGTAIWLLLPRPLARLLRRATGLESVFTAPR